MKKERVLTNVAILRDRNVIKREVKKILRYKIITLEVLSKRNLKTKVIPVTAEATGTISKSLRQYLSNVQGEHDIMNYRKQRYWALHTNCGKC
jgi:hypothetical protein